MSKFDVAMNRNQLVSEASRKNMFTRTRSTRGFDLPYGLDDGDVLRSPFAFAFLDMFGKI